MVLYISRDIKATLSGDIAIDSKGDLELADPLDTYRSAANFVLRTDYGDYAPDASVGCNLGSFVGKNNTISNNQRMEYNINKTLKEKIFDSIDAQATVVPFDMNEALCVVNIGGSYLISGEIVTVERESITYTFPFIEGSSITPLI